MKNQGQIMKPEHTEKNTVVEQDVSSIERQTYTIEEAAKILGICRAVAYRKGVLPTLRVGGRRLVPRRALERTLAETHGQRDEAALPPGKEYGTAGQGLRQHKRRCGLQTRRLRRKGRVRNFLIGEATMKAAATSKRVA